MSEELKRAVAKLHELSGLEPGMGGVYLAGAEARALYERLQELPHTIDGECWCNPTVEHVAGK